MTFKASRTDGAEPFAGATATASPASPVEPRIHARIHAITEPTRDWMDLGDGRWTCHVSAEDRREAVLSPLPEHQAVRLLEVDGQYHLLTGRVADDRAMKIAAEDLIAGF